jgi:hypothetical protein
MLFGYLDIETRLIQQKWQQSTNRVPFHGPNSTDQTAQRSQKIK